MTFYADMASTVLSLLTEFGQTITLRKIGPAVYDPTTSVMAPTSTDYLRKGAILDYKRINFGEILQNGTTVQGSDRRLLLDANGVAPTLADHIITADGYDWVIQDIKITDPSGASPVLYDCRVRK